MIMILGDFAHRCSPAFRALTDIHNVSSVIVGRRRIGMFEDKVK